MMTDKQDAPCTEFVLPGWQLLEVAGTDAAAFVHAQTMNDVRALAPGRWQWNGWLTPKGRVIALFALAMLDAQRFWLIVPDFPAAELAARLQRFVFRSKLRLRVREDARVSGAFVAAADAQGAQFAHEITSDGESATFDWGGAGGARGLRVAIGADADTAQDWPEAVTRWNAYDLGHGLPHLPAAQREAWTPQMLSLDRLHAFSLKKGCYPGQEIVARTHFLGQAKRELVRVAGSNLAAGADVLADGSTLGSVVAATHDEALAVLAVERPPSGWTCAGTPCHQRPLLDGLAR